MSEYQDRNHARWWVAERREDGAWGVSKTAADGQKRWARDLSTRLDARFETEAEAAAAACRMNDQGIE